MHLIILRRQWNHNNEWHLISETLGELLGVGVAFSHLPYVVPVLRVSSGLPVFCQWFKGASRNGTKQLSDGKGTKPMNPEKCPSLTVCKDLSSNCNERSPNGSQTVQ